MVTKEVSLSQMEPKSVGVVSRIAADMKVIARLSGLGVTERSFHEYRSIDAINRTRRLGPRALLDSRGTRAGKYSAVAFPVFG